VERSKISDLLSLSLFQLDPRVSSSKEVLWRSLVETAIYHKQKPLSKREVSSSVMSLLEQSGMCITDEVDRALENCVAIGSVTREDNLFRLTDIGLTNVDTMLNRARTDEQAFDNALVNCIASKLGYPLEQPEISVVTSLIKYVLEQMFSARGIQIEQLRTKDSLTLDAVLQAGTQYDPILAIKEKLKTVTVLLGQHAEELIISGIRDHFKELSTESKRYITYLYNKAFYHQILNLDPNLHAHQRQYFNNTRLYLDTNVLIPYLFEYDTKHKVTYELIEASKALGCQIMLSPATYEEMKTFISRTQALHSSLGEDIRVRTLLTETRRGRASNPILVTFSMKLKENPKLLWDNYIAPYLKLEDLLLQKSILVEHEEYDNVKTDANYDKVWHTIREIRYEDYPDRIVDHDADNFVLVHMLRQKHKPHPIGETVWLLSWDSNLCTAQRLLRYSYPSPHYYILEDWGRILLPYQNINNFAFDDYIMYLVRSSLGVTIDIDGLDLDFLEPLHRPEFDIELLLSLDDADYVADTLAAMQQNRQIRALAQQARTSKTPEEAAPINRQLSLQLLETVSNAQKSSKHEADQLAQKVQQLEVRLHQIQTRTIWQRLKAVFKPQ
jgi:predicted nucleic acid-binding protein/uncharacterized protein YecA (UPF0149 family)